MMLGCSGLEPSVITSRCLTTKDDEPPVLQNVPEQQKESCSHLTSTPPSLPTLFWASCGSTGHPRAPGLYCTLAFKQMGKQPFERMGHEPRRSYPMSKYYRHRLDHDESEVQGGREQASDPADGKATPPVAHVRALSRAHAPWTRRGPHGRLWALCRRLGSARAEPGQRGTRTDRRE
ncbi:unnamed protein product [Rangifer tarandus platyrhynchus]|uniref:Uncharacterized protein n=1 Tax=Rangifer tarandus platyrhynchus TaxID=3082113 RepID=A0ABN8ZWV6_RANTA|nr:unnamed protein product [Rangifer tarandus platyrhynchus]